MVASPPFFTLARFSEAFLVLKAQAVGLPIALVPAVMVVMNVVYAPPPIRSARSPTGRSARVLIAGPRPDRRRPRAGLRPAHRSGRWRRRALGPAYGPHAGPARRLVADAAPAELRGTAFGMFNLVGGLALLAASVIAGALWDVASPARLAGAVFTAVALMILPVARRLVATSPVRQPKH